MQGPPKNFCQELSANMAAHMAAADEERKKDKLYIAELERVLSFCETDELLPWMKPCVANCGRLADCYSLQCAKCFESIPRLCVICVTGTVCHLRRPGNVVLYWCENCVQYKAE